MSQPEKITPAPQSYLEALNLAETLFRDSSVPIVTNNRLYELCTTPMETALDLRPITPDEAEAIDLILAGELIVPYPPLFLNRIYNGRELAAFQDLFQQLEYPLMAHLEPGQVLSATISHFGMLKLMETGSAACTELADKAREFRKSVARIVYTSKTRTISFYFRGKRAAETWSGWKVPFMGRFLPLFDYKTLTTAKDHDGRRNHVRLGMYSATMVIRGKPLDSWAVFHLTQDLLGLHCFKVIPVKTDEGDIEQHKWRIHLVSEGCLQVLETYTHIRWKESETLLHHHEVFKFQPCPRCGSGFHPASGCTNDETDSHIKTLVIPAEVPQKVPKNAIPAWPRPAVTSYSDWVKLIKTMPKMKKSTKNSSNTDGFEQPAQPRAGISTSSSIQGPRATQAPNPKVIRPAR
jgi:hypothetical protein